CSCSTSPPPPWSTPFPYTTLFRSVGEHRSALGGWARPSFFHPCPAPWARCPTTDRGPFRLVREGGGVFLGPVPKRCFSCREVTVAPPGRRVGGVLHHRGQMYGVGQVGRGEAVLSQPHLRPLFVTGSPCGPRRTCPAHPGVSVSRCQRISARWSTCSGVGPRPERSTSQSRWTAFSSWSSASRSPCIPESRNLVTRSCVPAGRSPSKC